MMSRRDPARMRFGVEIACRLRATVPKDAPDMLEVREDCRGAGDIGAFVNRFTLRRGDGALLGSLQWIGPGLPSLSTGLPTENSSPPRTSSSRTM